MANLSITSACNRSCDYCFAARTLGSPPAPPAHMSAATFERALDFLQRSDQNQARLLGGEPTLHPEFVDLVERALRRGLNLLVFTNGMMPPAARARLATIDPERCRLLLNVHEPGTAADPDPARDGLPELLNLMGPRLGLGYNIRTSAPRLGFLLDLTARYGLSRSVRLGLAHPDAAGRNRFLPPRSYARVGERVARFVSDARQQDVEVTFDCGFTPCMFPPDELHAWGPLAEQLGTRCNPLLDILPDGTVVPCYGLAECHRVPFRDEDSAETLQAEFARALRPLREATVYPECGDCAWRGRGRCQGGCLSAARLRVRRRAFSVSVAPPRPAAVASGSRETKQTPDGAPAASPAGQPAPRWSIPYVDQPPEFWRELAARHAERIGGVYFPLPAEILGSGRPPQPQDYLSAFLRRGALPASLVLNPPVLNRSVDELAPKICDWLQRMDEHAAVREATVASIRLAKRLRRDLPRLRLVASTLLDVGTPAQVAMLEDLFDVLVPASRVMRDLPALQALREAFPGRIRLIVNEACLPGCPHRGQHFYEMAQGLPYPQSLCDELLAEQPWLRLTGAWVLPQHLAFFDGVYDELKLAGRATLREPTDYRRVLDAYLEQTPLFPHEIGGGPASVQAPLAIDASFYRATLTCGRRCHACALCRDYYDQARAGR